MCTLSTGVWVCLKVPIEILVFFIKIQTHLWGTRSHLYWQRRCTKKNTRLKDHAQSPTIVTRVVKVQKIFNSLISASWEPVPVASSILGIRFISAELFSTFLISLSKFEGKFSDREASRNVSLVFVILFFFFLDD